MGYVEEEKSEFIMDIARLVPVLNAMTEYYSNYTMMTMKKDLHGNPEQYKIKPRIETGVKIPLENFVEKVTEGKEIARIKGSFNLLEPSGDKLVDLVYKSLDRDARLLISPPLQWLVWLPKEKKLTRMCWVIEISGEIVIRPYGGRNLLLEVQQVKFDKINEWSTTVIKRHALEKQRLNNEWRSLVAAEELAEAAEGFGGLPVGGGEEEESNEETPPEVGEVE